MGKKKKGSTSKIKEFKLRFDGFKIADLSIPDLPHLDGLSGTSDDVTVTADFIWFGFGQDTAGEIYVMGRSNQRIPGATLPLVVGQTGVILLIDDTPGGKTK